MVSEAEHTCDVYSQTHVRADGAADEEDDEEE